MFSIGTEVKKLFAGAGRFTRKFNKIDSSREDSHQVFFQEDGDIEFMSIHTIIYLQQESSVAVGDGGFKFCQKVCRNIYTSEVVEI